MERQKYSVYSNKKINIAKYTGIFQMGKNKVTRTYKSSSLQKFTSIQEEVRLHSYVEKVPSLFYDIK